MKRSRWSVLVASLLLASSLVVAVRGAVGVTSASAATGSFTRAVIASDNPSEKLGKGAFLKFDDVGASVSGSTLTITLNAPGQSWTLRLRPKLGDSLNQGIYLDSRRTPTESNPGLDFSGTVDGSARTCTEAYGLFTIRSLAVSGSTVDSAALDFDVRCDDPNGPVIGGWLAYRMATGPIDPVQAGELVPVTPTRLRDTRDAGQGALGPGSSLNVPVTGVGPVPGAGSVLAVVLNVTVVDPSQPGFLTVYPTGTERPIASNLNFRPGQVVPNLVVVKVGNGGMVTLFNSAGQSHVIVDVVGYFAPDFAQAGARFRGQAPNRVLDTRTTVNPMIPGRVVTFQAGNPGDVAAVLNVTVDRTASFGFVTVYPGDLATPPAASNLNFAPGETVPNLVVVKLDATGKAKLTTNGWTDVVVDVVGRFVVDRSNGAGRFVPTDPKRLVDTRTLNVGGALAPPTELNLGLVGQVGLYPFEASGVVFNATVTDTTDPSFLTVWPTGTARPIASNLNWKAGDVRPNLVMMGTGTDGYINFFNFAGRTNLIVDSAGWFTG